MDFSAVSLSNVLKLGGCFHPSLTHNSVEPVFLIHSLFMFYGYKRTAQFGAILKKTLKGHQYGYQMKGIGLGSKNMSFIFRFLCLHFVNINNSQWLRNSLKVMRRWRLRGQGRSQRTLLF
jgi:hypothetical protein